MEKTKDSLPDTLWNNDLYDIDWLVFWFLSRDLSVDAGLPPHQYHIHPLPQHYQHYLTSPRMHHFPRNNASTQVVSPLCLIAINHVCLDELRFSSGFGDLSWYPTTVGWPVFFWCCFFKFPPQSVFYLSSSRLSMRSETTHIPSCTCWLCRVSTPPATRLLLERATRFALLPSLSPQQTHTSLDSFIIVFSVTNALDMLECVTDCLISNYSGFQMPQMVQLPLISWYLFSFE